MASSCVNYQIYEKKKIINFQIRKFSFLTLKSRIATITQYFKHAKSHIEIILAWMIRACNTSTPQIQYPARPLTFTCMNVGSNEILLPDLFLEPEYGFIYWWFCASFWKCHIFGFDMRYSCWYWKVFYPLPPRLVFASLCMIQ